jgi:hypothetical protein
VLFLRYVLLSFFTLCELKADKLASDPNGPFGLGVVLQQLTGSPAMGSGVFCWELYDCIFRDWRLHRIEDVNI